MAIPSMSGYDIKSINPVDERFNLTKSAMLSMDDDFMPPTYPCWCPEDGKYYVYNKTNTVDPVTGKFRLFEGGGETDYEKLENIPVLSKLTTFNSTSRTASHEDGTLPFSKKLNLSEDAFWGAWGYLPEEDFIKSLKDDWGFDITNGVIGTDENGETLFDTSDGSWTKTYDTGSVTEDILIYTSNSNQKLTIKAIKQNGQDMPREIDVELHYESSSDFSTVTLNDVSELTLTQSPANSVAYEYDVVAEPTSSIDTKEGLLAYVSEVVGHEINEDSTVSVVDNNGNEIYSVKVSDFIFDYSDGQWSTIDYYDENDEDVFYFGCFINESKTFHIYTLIEGDKGKTVSFKFSGDEDYEVNPNYKSFFDSLGAKISEEENNAIEKKSDGLFVPKGSVLISQKDDNLATEITEGEETEKGLYVALPTDFRNIQYQPGETDVDWQFFNDNFNDSLSIEAFTYNLVYNYYSETSDSGVGVDTLSIYSTDDETPSSFIMVKEINEDVEQMGIAKKDTWYSFDAETMVATESNPPIFDRASNTQTYKDGSLIDIDQDPIASEGYDKILSIVRGDAVKEPMTFEERISSAGSIDTNKLTVEEILGDEVDTPYHGDETKSLDTKNAYDYLNEVGSRLLTKFNSFLNVKDKVVYQYFNTFAELNATDMSGYPNGVYVNVVLQDENYPRPDTDYYYSTIYSYISYRESDDGVKPYYELEWDLTQANDEDFNEDYMYIDNLATGKSSTSSSGNSTYAFDGSVASRWESNQSDPQWIAVDLGGMSTIQRIGFCWETASAKDYYIELSVDGNEWTRVAYVRGLAQQGTYYRQVTLQHPCKARHIRMYGVTRNTAYGYSIYEMGVYGKSAEGTLQFTGKINMDAVGIQRLVMALNEKTQFPTTYVKQLEGAGIFNKETYDLTNVGHYENDNYTKYNSIDGLTVLDSTDDVATIVLGSQVRTPTIEELKTFNVVKLNDEDGTYTVYHGIAEFDLHHFGNPTVSRGTVTFTYDPTTESINVDAKSAKTDDPLDFFQMQSDVMPPVTFGNSFVDDDGYTHYSRSFGKQELDGEFIFLFLYSVESMGGNEMTAERAVITDPNVYRFTTQGITLTPNANISGDYSERTVSGVTIMSSTVYETKTSVDVMIVEQYQHRPRFRFETSPRCNGLNILPVSEVEQEGFVKIGNLWWSEKYLGALTSTEEGIYFQYATKDNADERYTHHAFIYNKEDNTQEELVLSRNLEGIFESMGISETSVTKNDVKALNTLTIPTSAPENPVNGMIWME